MRAPTHGEEPHTCRGAKGIMIVRAVVVAGPHAFDCMQRCLDRPQVGNLGAWRVRGLACSCRSPMQTSATRPVNRLILIYISGFTSVAGQGQRQRVTPLTDPAPACLCLSPHVVSQFEQQQPAKRPQLPGPALQGNHQHDSTTGTPATAARYIPRFTVSTREWM